MNEYIEAYVNPAKGTKVSGWPPSTNYIPYAWFEHIPMWRFHWLRIDEVRRMGNYHLA